MTDTATTRRQEFATLMEQMQQDEAEAVEQINTLFTSDDMGTLLAELTRLREKTIPGGHYDQIIGASINVMNSTREMANQAMEIQRKAAEVPAPVPEENEPQQG